MDIEKLQELIRIFEASELAEIEVEQEGLRVILKKRSSGGAVAAAMPSVIMPSIPHAPTMVVAPEHAPVMPAPGPPKEELPTIDSPMVGTFYVAPAPGEPPFVRDGDTVEENQTVCIVEAMKLMNEVAAKFPAVIEKVLVENGEPVEFGQPLFVVRPL